MKSTGIVRRIDDLGRVVLPVELRRTLDLEVRDPVEIFIEGDAIVLRKYDAACLFCGATRELLSRPGKADLPELSSPASGGNKRINRLPHTKHMRQPFLYTYTRKPRV